VVFTSKAIGIFYFPPKSIAGKRGIGRILLQKYAGIVYAGKRSYIQKGVIFQVKFHKEDA